MKLSKEWKQLKPPATKGTKQLDTTVARIFAASAMPYIKFTDDDVLEMIMELGIPTEKPFCFYCGDPAVQWDHLGALVKNSKPTGFITCIANLIPSCNTCNTSRGNTNYEMWMRHLNDNGEPIRKRNKCPKCRGRSEEQIQNNIELIQRFEKWADKKMTRKLNLENIDDEELKKKLIRMEELQSIIAKATVEAQELSIVIRSELERKVDRIWY